MGETAIDLAALPRRIPELLDRWASETPDATALVDAGRRSLSYAALRNAVTAMAELLAEAGVRGGDRVLIVNENAIETVVAVFAALRLDAWTIPVNARLAAVEIDRIREHAQPRAIVITHGVSVEAMAHADRLGAIEQRIPTLDPIRILPRLPATPEPVETDNASQVAAVIYTSGTTGHPKGVMLTHRNLLFTAASAARLRALGGSDHVLQVVPIAHVFGLSSILFGTMTAGAKLELVARFDPARLADALETGVTLFQGVPALFAKLIDYLERTGRSLRMPHLRYISAGGSPLDIDWKRSIELRFSLPLNNGYGLTECASNVALTRSDPPRDDDSIGLPIPGVEVRFVGPDGVDVADGQIGECWTRGPNLMKGYYHDPVATQAAVTADGWLRTGDLGYRADDGHLFIVGRAKELIIRSGFNVYLAEVETALNALAGVIQSAVIGRKAAGNEEIVAVVEAASDSGLTVEDLRQHVRARLAAYKQPQHYFIVEKLPATATGKILKVQLAPLVERMIANCRMN
jgi:acyl-CoA synthetase (AMP-forming)/AMP-acid ligase II